MSGITFAKTRQSVALSSGTRLGAYEILTLIGSGGMGEVYRATDTKLRRDVAIKVLPAAFATDPERIARFQREAELLATLNHPNIAAVYGIEESPGATAIVLELVEGETLADLIARGPLEIGEAIGIARQLADALEAAHDRGVIHRDLKPANIKVTPDGKVKVLDFGLAKMAEREAPVSKACRSPRRSVSRRPTPERFSGRRRICRLSKRVASRLIARPISGRLAACCMKC
jgi:eukaryotic-like serine/threonine-protein kinase